MSGLPGEPYLAEEFVDEQEQSQGTSRQVGQEGDRTVQSLE